MINWTLLKLRTPALLNDTVKRMKKPTTYWEKYLQLSYLIKDTYLESVKKSLNSEIIKQFLKMRNQPFRKLTLEARR